MKPPELSKEALQRAHQLEHTPPGKLLLQYSVPAIIATMVHATYNVVDRMFVGRAVGGGDDALTALAVSFPVMMIMMSFGMMFGRGTGALMSISLGEEKHRRAELLLGQGLILFLIISALFIILGLPFIQPLLYIFGAGPQIMPIAKDYLSIILWGVLFHEISFGVNSFIRAEGNIKYAMYTAIIGCGLNIFLDWVLMFKFHMGVKGAAIATITSQAVSAGWVMWYYFGGKSSIKLKLENLRIDPKLSWRVIKVGSPSMLMNLTSCVLAAIMNNQLREYGPNHGRTAIATAAVIFTLLAFIFMPLMGICQGAQPILGYNFGAANYDRVRKTLRISLIAATIVATIGYILAMLYPMAIITPFAGKDSKLPEVAPAAMRQFMLLMPVVGVIFIGSSYFQSVSKPFRSVILPLVRQLAFIPLVMILPLKFGLDGIWMCEPISAGLAFALSAVLLVHEQKNLKKRQALAMQPQEV